MYLEYFGNIQMNSKQNLLIKSFYRQKVSLSFIYVAAILTRLAENMTCKIPYIVRTFPENVYNINETKVFDSWIGGLLGVIARQMSDFNDFAKTTLK